MVMTGIEARTKLHKSKKFTVQIPGPVPIGTRTGIRDKKFSIFLKETVQILGPVPTGTVYPDRDYACLDRDQVFDKNFIFLALEFSEAVHIPISIPIETMLETNSRFKYNGYKWLFHDSPDHD